MAEIHFLELSKKVTINLDKVIRVRWAERDGFGLSACITYETRNIEYYRGEEAKTLRYSLSQDASHKKIDENP